ncbi:MAG: menaquinone biosynthesis decarboxylase [Candidatus Tectomicrobia bacterium]|nr:menaquinone biosynthesis decarboxylase [Candidatus Tectomicrobia bacterium]
MAYDSTAEFVAALEAAGELKRIPAEVDPVLEIAEIADRVVKGGGPALLFERVKGHGVPLLINALGSERRMCMALGVSSFEDVATRIRELANLEIPPTLIEKLKRLPPLLKLANIGPEVVSSGPCKEVVVREGAALDFIPALQCWPEDGGRYITTPQVYTKDLSGKRNVGMYRMQVFDRATAGMHWHRHHDGARHYHEHVEARKRMEAAVALGGDPILTYVATSPLPPGMDELLFAGFLRQKKVRLVPCETVDLEVPADADIVLEGYLEPGELRREGPFGDHTGFYSLADDYPVFHLTCFTRRRNPIYTTTVVGPPPMEDLYLGKATERIFLPLIQMHLPEVVDIHMPAEGAFHNLVIVSIRKRYPFHARKVMHALWGMGQMMFAKVIVVVDEDVDVQNLSEAAWIALSHIDPRRDVCFVDGPAEVLDHASPRFTAGSKMGVDATRKWKEEGFERGWPAVARMSGEVKSLVNRRWKEYGFDPGRT